MQGREAKEISASQVKEYEPGEIVAAEGEKNDVFHVILKG